LPRIRSRSLWGIAVALGVVGLVTAAVLWALPAQAYIFSPDQAKPLEAHVRVVGAHPRGSGDVYYVDVFVRKASLLERLLPFLRPDGATLVPERDYLPPSTSQSELDRLTAEQMTRSRLVAPAVALRALGYPVRSSATGILVIAVLGGTPAASKLLAGDVIVGVDGHRVRTPAELRHQIGRHKPGEKVRLTLRRSGKLLQLRVGTVASPGQPKRPLIGVEVDQAAAISLPIKVRIDLSRVEGPSAGLPFALEVARMLGRNVTHGCRVAATGELSLAGAVLPVGGLKQKTIGARRSHVNVFLVPAGENAAEARANADGLRIMPVKTFQQALQKLATARLKC
jgi:PDZ domain-containing protein